MEDRWTPGRYISIISRKCQLYLDRKLSFLGLGRGLYVILLEIEREEGLNQKELAIRVVLDQASVTRSMKRLSDLGFVYRVDNESDKRARNIFLTEAGKRALASVRTELQNWDDLAVKNFAETERKQLEKLLEKMALNL